MKRIILLCTLFIITLGYARAEDCGRTFTASASVCRVEQGCTPGYFTVAHTGNSSDTVFLAVGNLEVRPSNLNVDSAREKATAYRFAEAQAEVVGADNVTWGRITNRWYDLFAYGNATWTQHPIFNAGDQPNIWKVLSKDQWQCLFERTDAEGNLLYAFCQINVYVTISEGVKQLSDVNGILLLPDAYDDTDIPQTRGTGTFVANHLENAQWTVLESKGVVFLPCTGVMTGTEGNYTVTNTDNGYYWTFTSSDDTHAYAIHFADGVLTIGEEMDKTSFLAVHPYREVIIK